MSAPKGESSFKNTAQKWQQKANESREDAARRAGVSTRHDSYVEYKIRSSKSKSGRKSSTSNRASTRASSARSPQQKSNRVSTDSKPSVEMSMRNTQQPQTYKRVSSASGPGQDFNLTYHEPVRVRFNSSTENPSKKK